MEKKMPEIETEFPLEKNKSKTCIEGETKYALGCWKSQYC